MVFTNFQYYVKCFFFTRVYEIMIISTYIYYYDISHLAETSSNKKVSK